ncbi:transaldolase [Crocosphaera subtropica ATCC 51142]|uniref:Transaldolase n=1 Tax=Crocosphaera subtropica (strain ATCC 51142 / BH68) TaxID=43989 RepID=B1WWK2_CROS5|nr:transaldolase [Crocosphaera subtropica]ACB50726.1 transaldolase [Crocosphaera subtropica ATCC 51142]
MSTNPLLEMQSYGQSIWMDNLTREVIETGELNQLIENRGLRGLTSNPAIFEKAINNSDRYDQAIQSGHQQEKSSQEIYESLVFEDIRKACDIFRPIYEESNGLDGYVSIEVSPHLAHDIKGTIAEAIRFYEAIEKENVMIKVPGTLEGFAAIEQLISRGINVNVTLLFSVDNYRQAAWAYIRGLEARVKNNQPIDNIASVASFFLSRIDTKVDKRIEQRIRELGTESLNKSMRLRELKGDVAVANAKIAYQTFKEITASSRWKALEEKGAKFQRLLWASTSTKDPDYSDVKYVNELVGEHTINTLPPTTLEACADHCDLSPNRIETDVDEAYQLFESLKHPDIKINMDEVLDELLEEGIEKFVNPYDSLLESIENQAKQLTPS